MGDLRFQRSSFAGRFTPAAKVADELVRSSLQRGGASRIVEGKPGLVIISGVRPDDAPTLRTAAEDLIGGVEDAWRPLELVVRDWTLPDRLRKDHVERLLLEACTMDRGIVVLCLRKRDVPKVLSAVADAMVTLEDLRSVISDVVEEVIGFVPDPALVARLRRLPLAYLNLLVRPGMSRDRMWSMAAKLRMHASDHDAVDGGDAGTNGRDDRAASPHADPDRLVDRDLRPERLEDLPGMGKAGEWGLQLAADLAAYREGSLPWSDLESGMLLHGPPGTGKTLFAKALAGSCGVPLHAHSIAAWQAKGHLGDLLKAMRGAFAAARKTAPCILFLDELDSVGSRDEPLGDHASYQRQVINGLLECLDGVSQRDGLVVVGATNRPNAIDRAVLRPGRLGRQIEIRLPEIQGRIGILEHHLRGDLPAGDLTRLADEIGEVSGAALAQIVREARAAARRERRPLAEADLWSAVPRGVLLSDEAYRRLCIHEAGHFVVGMELAPISGLVPTAATVRRRVRNGNEPRTEFRIVEGFDTTRESIEANVIVLMAGLAAEEVILGSRGIGSGGTVDADLVCATQLVMQAEFSLGLGERLQAVSSGNAADAATRAGDDRVELTLARCLREARHIVNRRRDEVEAASVRLADRKSISVNRGE